MPIKLTLKELEMLKESLLYSIINVQNSQNYSHETYILKKEKANELEELKSKVSEMIKEIKNKV